MSTQFTPGPWTVGNPHGTTHYVMVGGHTEIAVLRSNQLRGDSCCVIEDRAERGANASLIASAPDMYALLERLANPDYGELLTLDDYRQIARATLAKARGES